MFWKDRLSKRTALEYDLSRKMVYFPENMILFFRRKMIDDLFQKYTWKYKVLRIFGKDGISFSYKYGITQLSKKQR